MNPSMNDCGTWSAGIAAERPIRQAPVEPVEEYRLYKAGPHTLLMVGVPILMVVIGGAIILPTLSRTSSEGAPPVVFAVAWLGMAGFSAVQGLRQPRRIEWRSQDRIAFIGPLRKLEVDAREVESIKPWGQPGFLAVRTSRGKLVLIHQFDRFHEFLIRLKKAHPGVEIRGCQQPGA